MSVPLGPIDTIPCCAGAPGTYPPPLAPYVVSLNGLSGILLLNGQGAITITQSGGVIYFSLAASAGLGTVTSVAATSASTGLSISGSPITTAGTLTFTLDATLQALSQASVTADTLLYGSGVDQISTTAFTAAARSLLDDTTVSAMRATLGGTTVGQALFTATNPSAITFVRANADNSVSFLSASAFRTALSLVPGTDVQPFSQDLSDFVTNASWSGSDLTLVGGLNAGGDIVSNAELRSVAGAPAGNNQLFLTNSAIDALTVTDHGQISIELDYASAASAFTITNSSAQIIFDLSADGNLAVLNQVSAALFEGDGAALTNLSASELVSGTVPSGRIVGTYSGLTGTGTLTTGALGSGFSVVAGAQGGTGVANTGKTITLGGNLSTSGAFACTFTLTAATNVTLPTSGTLYGTQTGSITSAQLALSLTDETGSGAAVFATSPALLGAALTSPTFDKTITPGGTTGAQTINKVAGSVNFAAAATTLVVTNSLCTANSRVLAFINTDDVTAVLKNVVCTSGSFTIKMATAPTAECAVGWLLII